jgi:hypothetical protein
MQSALQDLYKNKSILNTKVLAARLFHLTGCNRYLQGDAFVVMLNLIYLLDSSRAQIIFQSWVQLIREEMEFPNRIIICYKPYDYFHFSHLTTSKLFNTWLLFHLEKDSWFGFRNRHQSINTGKPKNFGSLHKRKGVTSNNKELSLPFDKKKLKFDVMEFSRAKGQQIPLIQGYVRNKIHSLPNQQKLNEFKDMCIKRARDILSSEKEPSLLRPEVQYKQINEEPREPFWVISFRENNKKYSH